jgi:UDP-glucose 4-epimerase
MILVTGATGFVGKAFVDHLLNENKAHSVVIALRRNINRAWPSGVLVRKIGDLDLHTDWSTTLKDISIVMHCAARVHIMSDTSDNPLHDYRHINVHATLNLARQAATLGVKRFIFLSSIKVNGDSTKPGEKFTADDLPDPNDAYGISKMEAEQGLQEIGVKTGMEIVIIRPPLVYGPGVKGNFLSIIQWLNRGIPLPLGAISNKRSFISLDNLVNLMFTCIAHPAAANQVFLASDGEDVSTTDLIRRLGLVLSNDVRLIAFPPKLLQLSFFVIGKGDVAHRLCSSLEVDIKKTTHILNWVPPITLNEGLSKLAKGYGV